IDFLSPDLRPAFYAGLDGASTGPFDIVVDGRRDEQFLLGQTVKTAAGTFYDAWTSRRMADLPAYVVPFQALHYSLESSILPNHALEATAAVRIRAQTGKARVMAFELSRALTVDRVTGEQGDPAEFATYDLTFRWPRRLRLVATGSKLDEREDGEFRVGHWKTEKPIAVAGFNLGEYASSSVTSSGHSVDVYANRELEQSLQNRLTPSPAEGIAVPSTIFGAPSTRLAITPPHPTPSPADALRQLGKEIDSSVHFYETFSGPFPFHNLSVSPIPGAFGQGWPGLLYVS